MTRPRARQAEITVATERFSCDVALGRTPECTTHCGRSSVGSARRKIFASAFSDRISCWRRGSRRGLPSSIHVLYQPASGCLDPPARAHAFHTSTCGIGSTGAGLVASGRSPMRTLLIAV